MGITKQMYGEIQMQLEWFNDFTDYVQQNSNNIYNEACKYADEYQDLKEENQP